MSLQNNMSMYGSVTINTKYLNRHVFFQFSGPKNLSEQLFIVPINFSQKRIEKKG